MKDVSSWLDALGLGQYAETFEENAISWDLLPGLDDHDLKEIGIRALGHRKRLLAAASRIGDASPAGDAAAEVAPPTVSKVRATTTVGGAERRQLTVMFCDLVDSTVLSQRLDPEDLRDVISGFQDACKDCVVGHGGYVARYMGDGLLAYFGYPAAGEDDAERSVRAGLALMERLDHPIADVSISARVGIATGLVVVGDVIGEGASMESAVVGETPNLAARLQADAEPGAMLVSVTTHALTRGFFAFEDLGERNLKGLDRPQQVWRVTGTRVPESRFEALRHGVSSELVGRSSELGLLLDRWRSAVQGEGQVVLIGGEPGLGKSRLSEELAACARPAPHQILRFQCSPNQINTAYHPFITQLQQAVGMDGSDAPDRKLDCVEEFVGRVVPQSALAPQLLAAMLSLPVERYGDHELPAGRQTAATTSVLATILESTSRAGPVLSIFEDVHWLDPTSHEVLDALVAATARLPVLIVVTHRPEFRSPWRGHGHVTELRLNHLRQSDCMSIVDALCDGKALPAAVGQAILAKTDGVPLFVEELTRTVLASGMLSERDGRYVTLAPFSELDVPSSLNDSLMSRLDRLADAREIAQVGACIGREFPYALVLSAAGLSQAQVDSALGQLEAEQLIFRKGAAPDATYTFKHALIRDAAAGSLLNKDRRRIHGNVAALLEAQPGVRDEQPELLAHHHSEAGAVNDALPCWFLAGEKAARQETHSEAMAHLNRGLELLQQLAESPARDRQELDFQTLLGSLCLQALGYGAPEGERAYSRARDLFERLSLDDPYQRFTVHSGLRRSYLHHGQLDSAMEASLECLRLAEQTREHEMLRDSYYSVGTVHWQRGSYAEALAQYKIGAKYEPLGRDDGASATPEQAGTRRAREQMLMIMGSASNHSAGAMLLWECGYADQARTWIAKVLEFERTLEHPYFKSYYLCQGGFLDLRLRNFDRLLENVGRALVIAMENKLVLMEGWARVMIGWGRIMSGASRDTTCLSEGIAITDGSGSLSFKSYMETHLAEACLQVGQAPAGLEAIARAERTALDTGILNWAPETRRVKAELLLALHEDRDTAEACLREAVAMARRQHGRSQELRSTRRLARLLAESGRQREALEQLHAIYGQFSEGFDTADLKEAKSLLERLRS